MEHGIVCRMKNEKFGYFGWPSIVSMEDGTIIVASSGLRYYHVCPWGKTVFNYSKNNGRSWSPPEIINDTPLDDRDVGLLSLGGSKLLVSYVSDDIKRFDEWIRSRLNDKEYREIMAAASSVTEETVSRWLGSWIKIRDDDGSWTDPVRISVSSPHGPILLSNGEILYFGKGWYDGKEDIDNYFKGSKNKPIKALKSIDGGKTWIESGIVPTGSEISNHELYEPHVVELPSGKLIGLIRYQNYSNKKDNVLGLRYENFSIFQTESEDSGKTWTEAHPTGVYGSPPHVIRHSSGALVCVYGYRKEPYGVRAIISEDEGKTWNDDIVLRDDGLNTDLGYPASIELKDGSIFTVYYQKLAGDRQTSILWTRWRIY